MDAVRRFWTQPSSHYRNFQIAFAVLALNFAIPTVFYVLTPEAAIEQFVRLNVWLGGEAPPVGAESTGFWRYLGTANVAALAFMCFWMLRGLRHRLPVLGPLVFLKGTAATLWLAGFIASPEYPGMLAAALLDYGSCLAFVVFAGLAAMDIRGRPDAVLVPRPVEASPLGWTHFEQRWVESALKATLPASPGGRLPGLEDVDMERFWPHFSDNVPVHFQLGLRVATWAVTFWPILTFRSVRTFHGLSDERKDEVLRAIEESRFFALRQLTFVLKTTASFAFFRKPDVQRQFPTAYPGAAGDKRRCGEDADD